MTKEEAREIAKLLLKEEEKEKVKSLLKEKISDGHCGLFFTRNICGDLLDVIFKGQFFRLEICEHWVYFELFGCNDEEEKEFTEFYDELVQNYRGTR